MGLRELRRDASDLVRRVEGREEIEITVSGRPAARLVPVARSGGRSVAISSASLAELHCGVLVTTDDAVRALRLRRLSSLQRTFDTLPVDADLAASFGQLTAAVVSQGRQPRSRVTDLVIAATAHAHAARLSTCNSADLAGVEHLIEIVPV